MKRNIDTVTAPVKNESLAEHAVAPPFNWRAHLRIHPAAELFPLVVDAELKELASNIWENGLRVPIVGWASDGQFLLDGRNRLDALALLGLLYETDDHHVGLKKWNGKQWADRPGGRLEGECEFKNFHDGDPYAIALSLNVHRRHLTAEQKRELIAKLLKAEPEVSNLSIAKQVKADDKTVASGVGPGLDVQNFRTSFQLVPDAKAASSRRRRSRGPRHRFRRPRWTTRRPAPSCTSRRPRSRPVLPKPIVREIIQTNTEVLKTRATVALRKSRSCTFATPARRWW